MVLLNYTSVQNVERRMKSLARSKQWPNPTLILRFLDIALLRATAPHMIISALVFNTFLLMSFGFEKFLKIFLGEYNGAT